MDSFENNYKIAYLIICHKNPDQVNRLISKLHSKQSVCFVHVDSQAPFNTEQIQGAVILNNRTHGELFSFDLVKITIGLIEYALAYGKEREICFKYFCLMSGQDYPLLRSDEICRNLLKEYPKPFIDCNPWDNNNWIGYGSKECCWWKTFSNAVSRETVKNTFLRRAIKGPVYGINLVLRTWFSVKRCCDRNQISLYGGSQWWILPDDMIEYLANSYSDVSKQRSFYPLRYIESPDETYFQTVLMNSELAERIEVNPLDMVGQNCKTYANFCPPGKEPTSHPYVLTMEDKDRLLELAKTRLFARKFDTQMDSEILDWIDDNLLGSE